MKSATVERIGDETKGVAILGSLVQRHGSASEICRIYLKFDPELEPGTSWQNSWVIYALLRALGG